MNQIKNAIAFTTLSLLIGCSSNGNSSINRMNTSFEQSQSAYRLLPEVSAGKTVYKLSPAGKSGSSITNNDELVKHDVLMAIDKKCGFSADKLSETRIVEHAGMSFYEVWVFQDDASQFDSKTSALSVVMEQLPNNGGVNISVKGNCQTAPMMFTFVS